MRAVSLQFSALFVVTMLAACATTTNESFRVVPDRSVDIAYINVVADFSRYRRLQADEMGIFFPTEAAPSEQDLARVRDAFRTAFLDELAGYEITDKPGADVLLVRASLVDLRNARPDAIPHMARDVREIAQAGKLTFMIELLDSRTQRVLGRAADTSRSPVIDLPEDGTAKSDEVVAAAEHWARLFRGFLDRNLTGP